MDQASYRPQTPLASGAIRVARAADIPFMYEIAAASYPDINAGDHIPWIVWCIQNPERLVLVGERSFGVAKFIWQYGVGKQASLEVLAARPGRPLLEPFHMVRQMVIWAKQCGVQKPFVLAADTKVDFEPFAKRLGGEKQTTTQFFIPMELDNGRRW